MSDMENGAGTPVMPMSRALLLYLACLLGFMLVLMLRAGVDWLSNWVPILAYLGAGIFLNRTVLRSLIAWHPVYNTLQNVASAKFRQMLLWPFSYPALFIQLGVAKHL